MEVSEFFEGNLSLYRKIYTGIYSFLRKNTTLDHLELIYRNKVKDQLEDIGDIEGLLMEPINPSYSVSSKTYMDKNARSQVLGKRDTSLNFKEADEITTLNSQLT